MTLDATPPKAPIDKLNEEMAKIITNTPRASDLPGSRERKTEDLIAERGKTHGDYSMVSKVFKDLVDAFSWGPADLTPEQRTSLTMISMKMARIVCGNPAEQDHWDDIAGYAKLVADRCTK